MTPAELASHYSADELLAALCAKLDPADTVAAVRAIAPFLSDEDKAAREKRLAADRSRKSYRNRQKPHGADRETPHAPSEELPSESHGEASESTQKPHGADRETKEERFQTSKEETDQEKKPLRGKEKKVERELVCPVALDTPAFRTEFKRWMQFRRGLGNKPKDWLAMFEEQLRWLEPFGLDTATAILGQSIRNGWRGLFELKSPSNGAKPVNGQQAPAPPRRLPTARETMIG